jgi:hypothetical protein
MICNSWQSRSERRSGFALKDTGLYHVPVPRKPEQPARHDYEYERNGTANMFMIFSPVEGLR